MRALVLLALLALPASAQDAAEITPPTPPAPADGGEPGVPEVMGADLTTPEGVAALTLAACMVDAPGTEPDLAAIEAAGLTLDGRDGTSASFYSDLATLDLAGGPDTYACELRLAPQDEAGFAALAQALSAAIGEAHEIIGGETLPDGQSWQIMPSKGVVTHVALTDDGPATLITATTTAAGDSPAATNQGTD